MKCPSCNRSLILEMLYRTPMTLLDPNNPDQLADLLLQLEREYEDLLQTGKPVWKVQLRISRIKDLWANLTAERAGSW